MVMSVLALLVNIAFVVYIVYLLLRRQEESAKDTSPSTGDSTVEIAHGKSGGDVFHTTQDLEGERGVVRVWDAAEESSLERKQASRHPTEIKTHLRRRSYDRGIHVLVQKDDGTTFTAVTTAKSIHTVSVMDSEDPSGSVQVPCVRVRPLELKEQDTLVSHEAAAVRAVDDTSLPPLRVDSATAGRDAGLNSGRGFLNAQVVALAAFVSHSADEDDSQE
jgi:hypothetical protein